MSVEPWETLCPLCGVAPRGGPDYLAATREILKDIEPLVPELRQLGAGKTLDDAELLRILKRGFDAGIKNDLALPRGYGCKEYCRTCIGIGYWDEHGNFNAYREINKLRTVPDGREVDAIRLRDSTGYGDVFNTVVGLYMDDSGKEKEDYREIDCDPMDSPCIFLCEHCYHYLEAWIDFDALPERNHAFPNESEPLSPLPESSMKSSIHAKTNTVSSVLPSIWLSLKTALSGSSGILPELEYDGIENSLEKCQEFVFPGCWKNARYTALAIDAGLRGGKLLPALMRDSRAWMFMRPNLWPLPPKITDVPKFTKFLPGTIPTMATLPVELIIPILADLPLASVLTLSSACRYLRTLITDPFFLDWVLREALLRGSLRWILPVTTIPTKENRRARQALVKWLHEAEDFTDGAKRDDDGDNSSEDDEESLSKPMRHRVKEKAGDTNNNEQIAENESESESEHEDESDCESDDEGEDEDDTDGEDPLALLVSPNFPRLAFIRACWDSDSMMNRKRLWGQVKRFEVLWMDYRTNGWQEPSFYPAGSMNE